MAMWSSVSQLVTVAGCVAEFDASVKATVQRDGKHVVMPVRFRKRNDRGGRGVMLR